MATKAKAYASYSIIDVNDGMVWKGDLPNHQHSELQNPKQGWAYYNTTDKQSYYYDGSNWVVFVRDGAAGNSIAGVENYYYAHTSDNTTGLPAIGNSKWKTKVSDLNPAFNITNKYLWNYEQITYSGSTPTTTEPSLIGTYSKDGTNGSDGRGISSIVEYYKTTTTSTKPTALPSASNANGWTKGTSSALPQTSKDSPYLWNYQIVYYTDDTNSATGPVCVGTYGNSIKSTTEYYAATASNSAPSRYSSGTTINTTVWKTSLSSCGQSAMKPYVWNFERVSYTLDGNVDTDVVLLTSTPRSIETLTEYYQVKSDDSTPSSPSFSDTNHNSAPTIPTGWGTPKPSLAPGDSLWNCEVIKYAAVDTNGKNLYEVTPASRVAYAGTNGTNGADGGTGPMGPKPPVTSTVTAYISQSSYSSSVSTPTGSSLSEGWTLTKPSCDSSNKFIYKCEVTQTVTYSSNTDTTGTKTYGPWGTPELVEALDPNNKVSSTSYATFLRTTNGLENGALVHDTTSGELLINADLIRTGVLIVGESPNSLFEANVTSKTLNLNSWVVSHAYGIHTTDYSQGIVNCETAHSYLYRASLCNSGEESPLVFYCGDFDPGTEQAYEDGEMPAFSVLADGSLYATSAYIDGKINARGGSIGGFSINSFNFSSDSAKRALYYSFSNSGSGYYNPPTSSSFLISPQGSYASYFQIAESGYSKTWKMIVGTDFGIDSTGSLYANNAHLTGSINAKGGSIGGWTIDEDELSCSWESEAVSYSILLRGGVSGTDAVFKIQSYEIDTNSYTTLFEVTADGSMKAVRGLIGGWIITGDSLHQTGPNGGGMGQSNTIFLTGQPQPNPVTISGQSKNNWCITAGSTFGVAMDGSMACTKGYIGDFTIGGFSFSGGVSRQSLYYGVTNNASTLGSGGFVLCPEGAYLSRNGTGTSSGSRWVILAGTDFGVTQGGALYATSGKIGPVTFNSSGIGIGSDYRGTRITADTVNSKNILGSVYKLGGASSVMNAAITASASAARSNSHGLWISALDYGSEGYCTVQIGTYGITIWYDSGNGYSYISRRITWQKLASSLGTSV